ncbi:MAG: hypothetical protein WDO13_17605 [Verrucomicrobiota bacterium]
MGEVWIFGFIKGNHRAGPVFGLQLGWLSTSLQMVPIGGEGVLISFGHTGPRR